MSYIGCVILLSARPVIYVSLATNSDAVVLSITDV